MSSIQPPASPPDVITFNSDCESAPSAGRSYMISSGNEPGPSADIELPNQSCDSPSVSSPKTPLNSSAAAAATTSSPFSKKRPLETSDENDDCKRPRLNSEPALPTTSSQEKASHENDHDFIDATPLLESPMASQPIMDDMPTPHESAASPTSHLSQPPQESPPEMELEENIQSSQNADTNATMQRDAKQDLTSTKNISSPQPDEVGVEPDKSVQEPATKKQSAETYAEEVESDGEEAPLDLAKMSKFEYAQVAKLNPAQVRRYEQYRRSDLKNLKVKKVLTSYNPSLAKTSEQYIIAVKGLAKLFVGDVVELALEIKQKRGDKGALQPVHIREAYRRLRRDGFVPSTNDATPMFW